MILQTEFKSWVLFNKIYCFINIHSPANPRKPIQELRRPWTAALTRAGINHMRIHDLRHSFASMAAAIGEDIRRVKDVLGHTKITTTEIYSHTQTTQVRQTATNTAAAILGVKKT